MKGMTRNITINSNLVSLFYFAIFANAILGKIRVLEVILPILILPILIKIIRDKGVIKIFSEFNTPLILSLIILIIGTFSAFIFIHGFSLYPIKALLRYMSYFFVGFIVMNLNVELKMILKLVSIIIFLSLIYVLIQYFALNDYRPRAFFIHSNHLAYFLTFSSIGLLYNKNLFKYKRRIYLIVFFAFVSIALSKSLGGSISFLLFIYYYLFFNLKGKIFKIVGVLAVFVILFLNRGYLETRISSILTIDSDFILQKISSGNAGGSNSLVWRIVTWSNIINETKKNDNVVFGNGLESTSLISPYILDNLHHDPHNSYVRIFAETGLVGLFLYLLTLFWLFKKLNKIKKINDLSSEDLMSIKGAIVLFFIFLLAQLSGNIIVNPVHMWFIISYFTIIIKKHRVTI
ncbi:O-antigen ligase family protein [Anaerophaga thermohalophila]|uniref:O-antigen ligase family protein n=1 Tax=Anaerophaga thermohalophila TaxID=177400 RepID=UPI00030931D1|nr:O-antigen ligase family protein [Anaerophaga thermohalophila]